MTTKANRTRSSEKRIQEAKRKYGLEPGTGAALLRMAYEFAGSPWALVVALAALILCIYLIV
jgi:hypothetical protein